MGAPPAAGPLSVEPSGDLNVWVLPLFSVLDQVEPTPCVGGVSTDQISSVTSATFWEEGGDRLTVATESVLSVWRIKTAQASISSAVTSTVTPEHTQTMSTRFETNISYHHHKYQI